MKKITLLILCCIPIWAVSQGSSSEESGQTQGEFLGAGSFGATAGASNPSIDNNSSIQPPRVAVKTYKLDANIGGTWWEFNFFNNLPTFTIKGEDSIRVLASELLNQTGGILNASLGKIGYFANGSDHTKREIKGGQFALRAGTKLLDPPNKKSYSEFLIPVLQASFDIKYLVPLTKEKSLDKVFGNLSFRVYVTGMKMFRSKIYDDYFKSERGNVTPSGIYTINYEINLYVSNSIFISFGQSFANYSETIPKRTVFNISYQGNTEK